MDWVLQFGKHLDGVVLPVWILVLLGSKFFNGLDLCVNSGENLGLRLNHVLKLSSSLHLMGIFISLVEDGDALKGNLLLNVLGILFRFAFTIRLGLNGLSVMLRFMVVLDGHLCSGNL
jgi:hypothetical protein